MQDKRKTTNSANADRMGRFIGQMRVHEGITLSQLARGLCSVPFLHRIENGEREVRRYTRHIEHCLYGIAWNRVQKLSELTGEERELRGEEVRSLLKQAYTAAFISGCEYYKRSIGNYYLEVFGTEMNL